MALNAQPRGTPPGTPWRIHAVLSRSAANGPGLRFVIWSQGCTLACPGCFNPATHPRDDGEPGTAEELAALVLSQRDGIEGVTLTGGEPLEQPAAVARFCELIRAGGDLGIVILTGFTRQEITADPVRERAVGRADMVLAGRYNARRHLGSGLRGSDNKEYWARTGRYSPADFTAVADVELIVAPDGSVTVTGMPQATERLLCFPRGDDPPKPARKERPLGFPRGDDPPKPPRKRVTV